jgi:tripartite-type tricarboxylate transporter receptor subunit TctC
MRRFIRGLAALLLAAATASVHAAETYPARPIRLIVPYAAGQGTDIAARLLAEEIGKVLKQPLFVDNRPGAGGNIGAQAAATSAADGYTLLLGTNATHAANGFLYAHPGFKADEDFDPIAMVGILPLVFVTSAANPVGNMQAMLKASKDKPDALNIAVSTTTCRVAYELLKSKTGAAMFPVDFKGSAQSLTAVLGGHVQYMVDTITSLRAAIQANQVKALGVTSLRESRLLPGVKSVAEQGVDGYELVGWAVLYAPKGLPPEASRALGAAVNATLARPDVQDKLLQTGIEPLPRTGAELKAFGAAEKEKWGRLIKGAGLTAN